MSEDQNPDERNFAAKQNPPAEDPISRMPPQLREANRKRQRKQSLDETPAAVRQRAESAASVEELLARVQQLEQSRLASQFVDMAPEKQADPRLAALEQMSPFQQRLLEQTKPTPANYGGDREPAYNIATRWYLKPDGSFVQLQGDAKNRAYYADKGFRILDGEETQHFLDAERPRIIREQRLKAHLVGQIRKLIKHDPMLAGFSEDPDWDVSLDLLNIEGLQAEWRNLCSQTNLPDRKLPAAPRFRSDAAAERDPNMVGIETAPSRTARDRFEASLPDVLKEGAQPMPARNGQGRLMEVMPGVPRNFA